MKPLSTVVIEKKALLRNLHLYQKTAQLPIAPVLKSNAYGHGLEGVARILDVEEVPFFIVNAFEEAQRIRAAGVKKSIQVIGYTDPRTIVTARITQVMWTITSMQQLRKVVRTARARIAIQIKVDTGMHRQGIQPSEVSEALELLLAQKHVRLVGICSHFADADGATEVHTKLQIQRWHDVLAVVSSTYGNLPYVHISATAGSYYARQSPATVARLGIGLYGFDCSRGALQTEPALTLESTLTNIREIPRGARIGYNGTFQTRQPMTIATVPLGYYEGIDRRLSNRGHMQVRGVLCPIVGRVSMNITTIDISGIKKPKEGERVVVVAPNRRAKNGIEHLARICETITYELCVHINESIPRKYI